MRVTTRLAVSAATLAAGAGLLTAVPAAAEDGASGASTTSQTSVATALSAPTNLVALAGDGMATVTFTPVAGATAYEYSLDGATWLPLSDLTVTSASAVVSGLANGQPYSVFLRAAAAGVTGQASEPVAVTPVASTPAPVASAPAPVEAVAPAETATPEPVETVAPVEVPATANPIVEAPAAVEVPAEAGQAAPAAPVAEAPAAAVPAEATANTTTAAEPPAAVDAAYAEAVRQAVAAKWRAQWAAYQEAVRQAVAAKWRAQWEEAVRQAVAAKWREQAGNGSALAQAAVANAMSRIGSPYVWGGQGPWGFDCSGLMAWAYRTAGYYLPGGSYNQIGYGWYVDYNSLRPGDLVFYGPGGSQHVAMYIGNGNVVQASNYNTGVHVASIWYIGSPTAYKRLG